LPLLHGFEQGGLGLGRGPVDLVGQDDVGEQRAFQELELAVPRAAVFLDDFRPGDVGRHQVGSELDAAECQRHALRQGADHQGLGQAGHALQDAVAPAEESDQQLFDDLVLPDDDAGELLFDLVKGIAKLLDGFQIVRSQIASRPGSGKRVRGANGFQCGGRVAHAVLVSSLKKGPKE
jgi:hypothetical protein